MSGEWKRRLAFFTWAIVVSPLIVWLFREAIYQLDGMTFWVWLIGLSSLATVIAGWLMQRPFWELALGAALSAGIAFVGLVVTLLVACSGTSDCL